MRKGRLSDDYMEWHAVATLNVSEILGEMRAAVGRIEANMCASSPEHGFCFGPSLLTLSNYVETLTQLDSYSKGRLADYRNAALPKKRKKKTKNS